MLGLVAAVLVGSTAAVADDTATTFTYANAMLCNGSSPKTGAPGVTYVNESKGEYNVSAWDLTVDFNALNPAVKEVTFGEGGYLKCRGAINRL
jgi:hypothetical protein